MKFYTLDQVPISREDQVFKTSPVGSAIALTVMLGIAIGCLVAALRGYIPHGMSAGTLYFFATVFVLFALIPVKLFSASLQPTNWLLRATSSGIIIKYRAYENVRLDPNAFQAVGLDYSEIDFRKAGQGTPHCFHEQRMGDNLLDASRLRIGQARYR